MAATESTSIISVDLLRQVDDLLNGARLERIDTDEQLRASVELLKVAKRTAADLETERKTRVAPLNARLDEINAEYKAKSLPLKGLVDNIAKVGADYQFEQRRKEEEARREAERKAEEERRRLAEIESKRLADEERLRREAEEKIKAAEAATGDKREELIESANLASSVADTAAQEAVEAAKAIDTVRVDVTSIPKAITPSGFNARVKFGAKVRNYRTAMKWIVDNNEWSAIESEAFKKCVDSAMNKIAANLQDRFNVPGVDKIESSAVRVKF